jgi:hypothetical protein
MKLYEKLCRSAVHALLFFYVTGASSQTLPNGTFAETSWGAMEVNCISSDLCFASYESGTAFLYFSSPGQDANFQGYWAETESSEPCADNLQFPNIRTNAWGRVNLSFDDDRNDWTGVWGYCNAPLTKALVGARTGKLQTQSTQTEIKAECKITSGREVLRGPCLFESGEDGSFYVLTDDILGLSDQISSISVTIIEKGSAEVRGLTKDGINSRWGPAQRSTTDKACWTGSDFEICAY